MVRPVTNFSTQPWFLDRGRGPCLAGRRPSRNVFLCVCIVHSVVWEDEMIGSVPRSFHLAVEKPYSSCTRHRVPIFSQKVHIFFQNFMASTYIFLLYNFAGNINVYEQVVPDHRVTRKVKMFTVLASDIASVQDFGSFVWYLPLRHDDKSAVYFTNLLTNILNAIDIGLPSCVQSAFTVRHLTCFCSMAQPWVVDSLNRT